MLVELGNARPHDGDASKPLPGPAVTYLEIPDEYTCAPGADPVELMRHMAAHPDITQLPGHEAFVAVTHSRHGVWGHGGHGQGAPSWVHVEGPDDAKAQALSGYLSFFYGCPEGRPDDVEQTHWTKAGAPGVGPETEA